MKNSRLRAVVAALLLGTGFAIGHANELVLIHNPSAPAPSRETVEGLYTCRETGAKILDLPESDSAYADFYKRLLGKEVSQAKAMWARLVFTGKCRSPKQLPNSAAVKQAVAQDPEMVGYIEKSAVDASVRVAFVLK